MSRISTIAATFLCLLAFAGCDKRRQSEPVALTKLPDLAYPTVLPPANDIPAATTNVATPDAPSQPPKPATKNSRLRAKSRPARPATPSLDRPTVAANPVAQPPAEPNRVSINPGGPEPSTDISPPIGHSEEAHAKQSAAQLLQSTEQNLRSVTAQPSAEQQNMIEQIRNFMAQSRAAWNSGDTVRAHNLALKAHLLSDVLVQR